MRDSKVWKSAGAAFTLAELLIVLGIVALLGSLVFASLSASRERAKQIRCMSQLKQITVALATYAVEHNGYGPSTLQDGIQTADEISDGAPYLPAALEKYSISKTAFHCPSDQIAFFQENYESSYYYAASPDKRLFDAYAFDKPIDLAQIILIAEGMGLHRRGNNIAYMDGHMVFRQP